MADGVIRPWPRLLAAWTLAAATLAVAHPALAAAGMAVGGGLLLIAHGPLAAGIAALLRLPGWWRAIAALPAPLTALVFALGLPSWIFAAAFACLLLVFWGVARTRVPLYLSGPAEWRILLDLLPTGPCAALDVGSGLGGPILALTHARPDCRGDGIELAPLPWLASWLRARLRPASRRPRFRRGDWAGVDLGAYDLVFAFLSPAAMQPLWEQARRQMRPGSLFVSCEFTVPGARPWRIIEPPGGRRLLVWRIIPRPGASTPD